MNHSLFTPIIQKFRNIGWQFVPSSSYSRIRQIKRKNLQEDTSSVIEYKSENMVNIIILTIQYKYSFKARFCHTIFPVILIIFLFSWQPVQMENPYQKDKRLCVLCKYEIAPDYKNTRLLSQFVSRFTGRLYGRHITGLCKKQQRNVEIEIVKAIRAGIWKSYIIVRYDPEKVRELGEVLQ